MKKYILVILCVLSIGIFCSCQKEKVFKFPNEEIQSLKVYTNDFRNGTTIINSEYEKDSMKDFLGYLESLKGTRIDNIDIEKVSGLFYGVELNAKQTYSILFAGNYAITYTGEYYLIDGDKTEKMCNSIKGDTKVNNDVSYIVNQRYISLVKEHWDSKYMQRSKWTEDQIKGVQLLGDKSPVDTRETTLELTLENKTGDGITFGSRLELETRINGVWYNIDNMINDNVNLAWTDILYHLLPHKSKEESFSLSYYQPLPVGSYRLVKEVGVRDKAGYAAYEFEVR